MKNQHFSTLNIRGPRMKVEQETDQVTRRPKTFKTYETMSILVQEILISRVGTSTSNVYLQEALLQPGIDV